MICVSTVKEDLMEEKSKKKKKRALLTALSDPAGVRTTRWRRKGKGAKKKKRGKGGKELDQKAVMNSKSTAVDEP